MSETNFQGEYNLNLNSNPNLQFTNTTSQPLELDPYAKWYTRFAAGIIDILILALSQITILFLIFLGFFSLESLNQGYLSLSLIIIALLGVPVLSYSYYGYFLSKSGVTPGLKFIGLKLQTESGELLTFWQAIFRSLIFFPTQPINMLLILLTKRKQGLHDLILKTVCVKTDEKETVAKIVIGLFFLFYFFILIILLALGNNAEEYIKDTELQNPSEMQNYLETYEKIEASTETPEYFPESAGEYNTQFIEGSDFYEACMQANNDFEVDVSDFCLCAQEAYLSGMNLNQIASSCQNRLKMN